MLSKSFALSALLVVAACASAPSRSGPARAPGTDPCDMTAVEHRQRAAHEERRADVARWRAATSKQGVLEAQRNRREMASRPVAAAQHREAAEGATACR